MKKLILGLISMLASLGMMFQPVLAQEPGQISLSLSPQRFEMSANPGDRIENSFKIVNGTDQALTLVATPKNYTVDGEDGGVLLTDEDTNWSVADWLSVSPNAATIKANGSQIFDFALNVPADAEPGSHFGAIILKTEPIQVNETGPAVSQEIGPLILVAVAGDVEEGADLKSFKTSLFWFNGPVELETRVENTGNVHFKPQGTIVIKNMLGKEVTTINLQEQNVLPSSIRKLVDEWDPGTFAFGRYTADLSLVYGGDDTTIVTASTSFFVFPVLMSALVIGGLILLFSVIGGRRRIAEALRVLAGR